MWNRDDYGMLKIKDINIPVDDGERRYSKQIIAKDILSLEYFDYFDSSV